MHFNPTAMKRIAFVFLSLFLLWGCSKEAIVELVSISDTGCAREEPVTKSGENTGSQLILKYSPAGLVITRTNAVMNCSIKNGGIGCNVTNSGNTINFEVYELGEPLRCTCPVETMIAVLAGLRPGREYVLDYSCGGSFAPISFTYDKGLNMVIDLSLYML